MLPVIVSLLLTVLVPLLVQSGIAMPAAFSAAWQRCLPAMSNVPQSARIKSESCAVRLQVTRGLRFTLLQRGFQRNGFDARRKRLRHHAGHMKTARASIQITLIPQRPQRPAPRLERARDILRRMRRRDDAAARAFRVDAMVH